MMPVYVYVCESCGAATERVRSMREPEPGVVRCGACGETRARRDYRAELTTPRACREYRIESMGAGVHPDQIPGEIERARRHGVSIDFNRTTGDAIFTSPGQRAAYLRLRGMYDKAAYGHRR